VAACLLLLLLPPLRNTAAGKPKSLTFEYLAMSGVTQYCITLMSKEPHGVSCLDTKHKLLEHFVCLPIYSMLSPQTNILPSALLHAIKGT
jgi:hypothetical protein